MRQGVYTITCIVNNRIYCGSSIWIERRWKGHISKLRNGDHENAGLMEDFRQYGEDVFRFTVVLETSEIDAARKAEREMVLSLKENGNCYNRYMPLQPDRVSKSP